MPTSTTKKRITDTDRVFRALAAEMRRSTQRLRLPHERRPYFISYLLRDVLSANVWAKYGALFHSGAHRTRRVYAEVRVGSRRFDQVVEGGLKTDLKELDSYEWLDAPLENDVDALRYSLWKLTELKYEEALHQYYEKRRRLVNERLVQVPSSFSVEPRIRRIGRLSRRKIPVADWEDRVREYSAMFKHCPDILDPYVQIRANRVRRYYLNSEGSRFLTEDWYYELILCGWTLSPEGVYLNRTIVHACRSPREWPDRDGVAAEIDRLIRSLRDLRRAEVIEPYSGPALLHPPAAGTFFHETLGHRLEGERLLSETEGHTFKGRVGSRILPDFLSIVDDPTLESFRGRSLFGHYTVDDEGVPPSPVTLVEKGRLKAFLLSRTTVPGFRKSNGHGRHAEYEDPMARIGTLIVRTSEPVPPARLKERLLEEVRRQGREYGLIIRDIEGGETDTESYNFQAFKGRPSEIYRVDPDTGEETLVRGVEFIGTPVSSLQRVLAAGDDPEAFNGYCGAESGYVPVSSISPSILLSEIELQRSDHRRYREPILPPPWRNSARR